jgi:hypothetical protein
VNTLTKMIGRPLVFSLDDIQNIASDIGGAFGDALGSVIGCLEDPNSCF